MKSVLFVESKMRFKTGGVVIDYGVSSLRGSLVQVSERKHGSRLLQIYNSHVCRLKTFSGKLIILHSLIIRIYFNCWLYSFLWTGAYDNGCTNRRKRGSQNLLHLFSRIRWRYPQAQILKLPSHILPWMHQGDPF